VQYVLASWGFRTLDLLVDRRVLIPRPETEQVVDVALEAVRARPRPWLAADLGTGSGAIALSLAAELPPGSVEVWATDVSSDALAVARANLAGLGRPGAAVRVAHGSWFGALPPDLEGRLDLVVSNPPYVAAHEELPREVVAWEPHGALVSGPTGLEAVAEVVAGAARWLAPGGSVVVEVGETQGAAARRLAEGAGLVDVRVVADVAGLDRILHARRL
jgi:release factor glutamine methyltransferase